jgi:nickel-dependent lactate racemase
MINIKIPWQAWYGDNNFCLEFPDNCDVRVYGIQDVGKLRTDDIREAFAKPIDTLRIRELAKDKSSVVIAVEDITRPSWLGEILSIVIDEVKIAGVVDDKIKIIISTGAHRPLIRDELIKKLSMGIVDRFDIYNHNPFEGLVDIGTTFGNVKVKINRFFIEADLRIVIGTVIPHAFAGFSGGAKLVLPGLAGIDVLTRSHKFVMMGLRGGIGVVDGNKFREEIEEIVKNNIGVDISVNLVVNANRELIGVFVGDIITAHRVAVDMAKDVYSTDVPDDEVDVVVLNAYPKDMEILQIDNAFGIIRSCRSDIIKHNGMVILTSACTLGRGYHALFEPGMQLYKPPVKRRFLKDRDVLVFSPNINKYDFRILFWDGYMFLKEWRDVIEILQKRYPEGCSIAVFPYGAIQIAKQQ